MQAFDALFGGQRAGSTRNTGSDAARTSSQDDAGASGGFDRMLQAQGSRNVAQPSTTATTQARTNDTQPREADASQRPRASDEGKSPEARPKDASRDTSRAESKDEAPHEPDASARDADAASTAPADEAASSDATATTTAPTTTNDAAAPALPEQMLALLNGLAGAAAAPATAPAQAAQTLPPALMRGDAVATANDPRGGNATAPALPALAGTPATAAPPTDGEATAAFAMAMGAAAADAKTPDAVDASLDTTAIDDTAPASPPLSVSSMTNHPLPRATAAAVQANAPLGLDNGFEDGFSSRIAWMADQKVGHAEIRITPDHLGAIDVRLQVDGNRVNAEFHSAQPDVRHALESSLPRLRDMLGQQGLQLGQADVGQRQAQQQASNGQASSSSGSGNDRADAANDAGWTRGPTTRASRGLLDEYA